MREHRPAERHVEPFVQRGDGGLQRAELSVDRLELVLEAGEEGGERGDEGEIGREIKGRLRGD